MRELYEYLKKNIQIAAKSVKYNYKKYLAFFAAVFVIQTFFGVLLFSSDCSSKEEKQITEESFGCHLILRRLDDSQYVYLQKYAAGNSPSSVYSITETRDSSTSYFDRRTDVYITFAGNAANSYSIFYNRHVPSLRSLSESGMLDIEATPLINNEGKSASGVASVAVLPAAIAAFVLLTLLYTVRINNYRFEYGIYMACGADFRKLSENAIFEMLIITFAVFPVSAAVGYVSVLIIHGEIVFDPGSLALTLLLSLVISLGAVFFPMLTVSKIYPMKNIVSADNSGYVSSPRLSFEMLGRKFKKHYEPFSLFRFRKYYIPAILVTSAFASAACAAAYGFGLAKQREKYPAPEFSLIFTDDGNTFYDDELSNEVNSVANVAYTRLNITEYADELNSHIGFVSRQTKAYSEFAAGRQGGISYVYDKVKYNLLTEEDLAYLGKFSHEGDYRLALGTGCYAIVNQNIENVRRLSLKPGDKIYAAIKDGYNSFSKVTAGELQYLTGRKLLSAKIELYNYRYIEFTVAAVINDMPCNENLEIFLSEDAFRAVVYPPEPEPVPSGDATEETDSDSRVDEPIVEDYVPGESEELPEDTPPEDLRELITRIDVFMSEGLTADEVKNSGSSLRSVAEQYGGITVKNKNAETDRNILRSEKLPYLCVIAAASALLAVPILWIFAQTVFDKNRRSELNMLRAIGAVTPELRHIFITDGIVLSVLSGLVTSGFSFVLIRLLYRTVNKAASTDISLGKAAVYYAFSFPTAFYIIAVTASVITAFMSVYLTYVLYLRSVSDAPHSFSEE